MLKAALVTPCDYINLIPETDFKINDSFKPLCIPTKKKFASKRKVHVRPGKIIFFLSRSVKREKKRDIGFCGTK